MAVVKCPNCGAAQPDGTLECSNCQVIVAKFLEKTRKAPAESAPDPIQNPPLSKRSKELLVGTAAIAVVAFLLAAYLKSTGSLAAFDEMKGLKLYGPQTRALLRKLFF